MKPLPCAVLTLGLSTLAGCVAAPIAALGVVGNVTDIGSAAFSTGTEVFTGGRLESVEFCTQHQGEVAVRWMLNDLRLRTETVETDDDRTQFVISDDTGSKVEIELVRRTAAVCQMRINVGWFGSEAYARLLLKSVRGRLPAVTGSPATLPANPVDLRHPHYPQGFLTDEPGH